MGIVLQGGPHDSSVARAWPTTRAFGGRGPYCWSANRRRAHARIPLVRTSSELAVRRPGKAPEEAVPNPSPGRHAATRSRRGSSSSSPPTADGFGTGTPVPSPQSQSFSRGYGSILPTSLAYIVPSTRGCSPWRPDAVMSTTGRGRHSVLRIFKGRRGRTGHRATCGALPAAGPYLRLSRFQVPFTWNLSPLRPSKFSFEYLLLPPRSAPTAAPPGLTPKVLQRPPRPPTHRGLALAPTAGCRSRLKRHPFSGLVDSAGMLTLEPFSEDQGRSAVHPTRGIPPISFLAPCGFTHPLTRTHVRLLGPCFKTGRMGCPQAGAGSTQVPRHAVTARAANHDRRDGISTGISTARALAAAPIRTASLQDDTLGSLESASLASARLDTKALTTTTSRASVKGDSFLGQPHHGHGRPVSAPNDTHPHWGGVVGGDAMRDAQADVPSAEWLRAQLAFKNSMVHGILQFTPSIAFCYVLHRCVSRDIRCRESFMV
ncbi:hypothetical protein L6452_45869 [Arctium lappa]|nr:hypothetical protein L6452_45869 [Arctium lappa]